ncbi:MAG TPA: hypothetical protein PK109_02630 [Candidatus Paceibacterota bacterium]|nr:hypothetical protein [Candidatus Paceibacterota bacterium]
MRRRQKMREDLEREFPHMSDDVISRTVKRIEEIIDENVDEAFKEVEGGDP